MNIQPFYDQATATVTYVVSDPKTNKCAIIDSVRDYDPDSGKTSTHSADKVIDYIKQENLSVDWILETHIHADHLTAANYLKKALGGKTGIGVHIKKVLNDWVPLFNTQNNTPMDGSQFDALFDEGDCIHVGTLEVKIMHTPGHTPACSSYVIEDAVFVGDVIFRPETGTARTDFPGADARTLYRSIQKILSLPDQMRIFSCHDYPAQGEVPVWETTVKAEKEKNIMVNDTIDEETFIVMRDKKDKGKPVPHLLLPSLQVNLRAGDLGNPEENGVVYLKIPVDKL